MDLIRERPYVLWAGLLGASLIIAVAFYLASPPRQAERIIFFPHSITGVVTGQERYVPRGKTLESNVRILLDEQVLGPINDRDLRVVPLGTRVKSVIVRDRHAYVDFSSQIMQSSAQVKDPLAKAITIIEKTIRYNFPQIRAITVTIDGQLPGQPYFAIK